MKNLKLLTKVFTLFLFFNCILLNYTFAQKQPLKATTNRPVLTKQATKTAPNNKNPKNVDVKTKGTSTKDVEPKMKPSSTAKDVEAKTEVESDCVPPKYEKTMSSKQVKELGDAYHDCMMKKQEKIKKQQAEDKKKL